MIFAKANDLILHRAQGPWAAVPHKEPQFVFFGLGRIVGFKLNLFEYPWQEMNAALEAKRTGRRLRQS